MTSSLRLYAAVSALPQLLGTVDERVPSIGRIRLTPMNYLRPLTIIELWT